MELTLEHRIREHAYFLSLAGGGAGDGVNFWLIAEREVRAEVAMESAAASQLAEATESAETAKPTAVLQATETARQPVAEQPKKTAQEPLAVAKGWAKTSAKAIAPAVAE
ncbi:MAG: DUF2934 domain-containing protein, partial [Rhodoplanes sp.]